MGLGTIPNEAEGNIEARLAHAAVTFVVVGSKGKTRYLVALGIRLVFADAHRERRAVLRLLLFRESDQHTGAEFRFLDHAPDDFVIIRIAGFVFFGNGTVAQVEV